MAKKLTNQLRAEIVRIAAIKTFKTRVEAMRAELQELGQKLYFVAISEEVYERMMALPADFVYQEGGARFLKVKGQTEHGLDCESLKTPIYYNYNSENDKVIQEILGNLASDGVQFGRKLPMPMYMTRCRAALRIPYDHPVVDEFDKWERTLNAMVEEIKEMATSVSGVLKSVTTIKKLLEVWPESKEFIPEAALLEDARSTMLPVVVAGNLNDMLKRMQSGPPLDKKAARKGKKFASLDAAEVVTEIASA